MDPFWESARRVLTRKGDTVGLFCARIITIHFFHFLKTTFAAAQKVVWRNDVFFFWFVVDFFATGNDTGNSLCIIRGGCENGWH